MHGGKYKECQQFSDVLTSPPESTALLTDVNISYSCYIAVPLERGHFRFKQVMIGAFMAICKSAALSLLCVNK